VHSAEGLFQTEAYTSAMRLAQEQGFATVAFSLISASIFRGDRPLRGLLEASVRAVAASAYSALREVHMGAKPASALEGTAARNVGACGGTPCF